MKSMLDVERRPFPADPPSPPRRSRTRWIVGLGAGALCAAALGYLMVDQAEARTQYGRAHTSLGLTQQRSRTDSTELQEASRDLSVLKTQVGSDTTALSQDSSRLLGAQTSLSPRRRT